MSAQDNVAPAGGRATAAKKPGPPSSKGAGQGTGNAATILGWAERYALVAILGIIIVVFAVLPASSETFLSSANLRNLLANQAVVTIAAFAALIPIVAGEFDISIGALLGAVAYVAGTLMAESGVPVIPAVMLGLLAGMAVGAVNGFLVAYVGASSLIITLGMTTLLGGAITLISGGLLVSEIPGSLTRYGSDVFLGVPIIGWFMLVVALAVAYLLRYMVFGRRLLFIGSNVEAARLVGIRTKQIKFMSFVLAGLLAGIAGMVLLARSGTASPEVGLGYTLNALAAVFLGATTIHPGRYNVPGTIVGVFFVAVSVNGLTLVGAADWVDPVFNGAAVIIAVTLSTLLRKRAAGARQT
jgi:ribose transport system permease protein